MYYYEIYVENIKGLYTYKSIKKYEIGQWCIVNFINMNKMGLIINEIEKDKINFELEKIKEIIDIAPVLSIPYSIMELVKWVKDYYISDYHTVFKSIYPGALKLNYSKKVVFMKKLEYSKNNVEEITNFNEYMEKIKEVTLSTLKKKFSDEIIKKAKNSGSITINKQLILKNNVDNVEKIEKSINKTNVKLNKYQQNAIDEIEKTNQNFYLIKGITGSGKTEIYINLIKKSLIEKGGSIFLVPEISLTTQMTERLKKEFGQNIAILHSKLTQADRKKEWGYIRRGEKKVVIGARSAIFAPVENLKNIIIDEEHENTYKQDNNPRYHVKNVAIKRALLEKKLNNNDVKVILGSATPSFESYYQSKTGDLKLIELNKRYNDSKIPEFKLVDLSKSAGNFSDELLIKIKKTLKKSEQVMLILNRKSFSPILKCRDCKEIPTCPNCSISLSYYKKQSKLKCNYCGYERNYMNKCHKCESDKMILMGSGTEKIEEELKEYFPTAKIVRMDSESIKNREEYEKVYKDFREQKYDIMIGTQIISKGFHFPNVTLVGVVNSDIILNFPDFRAGEKTFQLLVQSAGRAGRGEKEGGVLIQTFNEENEVIKKTMENDYEGYYNSELKLRKEFNYPPFGRLIMIILSSKNEKYLEEVSKDFYSKLYGDIKRKVEMEIGDMVTYPISAPIYKINERYRNQIFIKFGKNNINKVKSIIKSIKNNVNYKNVRISIDVDPINMM